MKSKILTTAILVLGWALTACSGESNVVATAGTSDTVSSSTLNAQYDGALSIETQLALGTIKLDGTTNEVSSELATALLPLWKAARSLDSSDVVSQAEVQAVYRQIQEAMSQAQLKAIAAMQLTSTSVSDLGLNVSAASNAPDASVQATAQAGNTDNAALAAEMGADMGAGGGGGGMPAGGGGGGGGEMGGGGMPGGGVSVSASASASTTAQSTNPVLDAIISYLESKIA